MQSNSILYSEFQFDWRSLQKDQEIRVSTEGKILKVARQTLREQGAQFLTRRETRDIIRCVGQILTTPEQVDQAPDSKTFQIAKKIQLNLVKSIRDEELNRLKDEYLQFQETLFKKDQDVHSRVIAPSDIIDLKKIEAVTVSTVEDKEWQKLEKELSKFFEKLAKPYEESERLKKHYSQRERQLAYQLSEKFNGYNPLDDSNSMQGDRIEFNKALHSIVLKDSVCISLGKEQDEVVKKISEFYKKIGEPLLPYLKKEEPSLKIFALLDKLTTQYNIKLKEFCRELINSWSDECICNLLNPILEKEIGTVKTMPELFRLTSTISKSMIGAFFAKLAFEPVTTLVLDCAKTIEAGSQAIPNQLAAELLPKIVDKWGCTKFSISATNYFRKISHLIFIRWREDGLKIILGTLFLRGANAILLERAETSLHKTSLLLLGKALQEGVNEFKLPEYQKMAESLKSKIS